MEPMRIYLAGRATEDARGGRIPIREIPIEGSRDWLKSNLYAIDLERDIVIEAVLQSGSQDLQTLFDRGGRRRIPLANDTSFGVGVGDVVAFEAARNAVMNTKSALTSLS